MSLHNSILSTVGRTPLIKLNRIARNLPPAIALKGEFANPLGSVSIGPNVWAALQVAARPENKGKVIVTIGCSTGERYLSTALADEARKAATE